MTSKADDPVLTTGPQLNLHASDETLRMLEIKALAGAELSAAMAREQGRTPSERGGDALVVRARLRRRASSGDTSET